MAFWLKQKTDDFVTMTNLKGPLKKLDSAAAQGLDNLDTARMKVPILCQNWAKFDDISF